MNIETVNLSSSLYEQVLDLRYKLFFESHGLDKSIVIDEHEKSSKHLCISNQNELIAYGRLTEIKPCYFQISQMVVKPEFQNQNLGSAILLELLNIAKAKQPFSLFLNARLPAIKFYQKHGFNSVGQIFKSRSTGVQHLKMVYGKNT